jgi:hypothetical protein
MKAEIAALGVGRYDDTDGCLTRNTEKGSPKFNPPWIRGMRMTAFILVAARMQPSLNNRGRDLHCGISLKDDEATENEIAATVLAIVEEDVSHEVPGCRLTLKLSCGRMYQVRAQRATSDRPSAAATR